MHLNVLKVIFACKVMIIGSFGSLVGPGVSDVVLRVIMTYTVGTNSDRLICDLAVVQAGIHSSDV